MGVPMRGVTLLIVVCVFWSLAILLVALRIWSRLIKRQSFVFNDWAIFIALLFTCGLAVCNIIAVAIGGVGHHLNETTKDQQLFTMKTFRVVWLLQSFANSFVRLSILDLLRRIFKIRPFVTAVWIVMGCSVAYLVACFITFFALCRPIEFFWDPTIPGGVCGDRFMPFILSSVFNLVLDFVIIMLPLPVLWGLQMKTGRKLALTVVFGVGLVVCIITILRTVAVIDFNTIEAKADFTYTIFLDTLWSSLEPSLGIASACLPLLPPVVKQVTNSSLFTFARTLLSTRRQSTAQESSRSWRKISDHSKDTSSYSNHLPLTEIRGGPGRTKSGAADPYNIEVTRKVEVRRDQGEREVV